MFQRRWLDYSDFLSSPEWARLRTTVRRRAGGLCERCGEQRPPHYAHHVTYSFGWDCDPRYVAWLCENCHEFLHGSSSLDPMDLGTLADLEQRIRGFKPM